MAIDEDLYRILEVEPSADGSTIRASYRRLARRFHPDAHPASVAGGPVLPEAEAVRRMSEINRAWEVLRDPARRARYDDRRMGAGRVARPRRRPAPEGSPVRQEGTVLTFGRYAGWSLAEIARNDPDFLEWLDRSPGGRPHRDEIDALLRRAGRRTDPGGPLARPARFRA